MGAGPQQVVHQPACARIPRMACSDLVVQYRGRAIPIGARTLGKCRTPLPEPARAAVLLALVTGLVVDGIVNPVVEELYFRGYFCRESPAWDGCRLFSAPRYSRWRISGSRTTTRSFFSFSCRSCASSIGSGTSTDAMLTHCAANTIGALLSFVSFWDRDSIRAQGSGLRPIRARTASSHRRTFGRVAIVFSPVFLGLCRRPSRHAP